MSHSFLESNALSPRGIEDFGTLLRTRARERGGEIAFTFLHGDDAINNSITYGQLHEKATHIASKLVQLGASGRPVILLYPTGPEYISAFFGCLYAGSIAVPAYPPRQNRSIRRLQSIVQDAEPVAGLTSRRILAFAHPQLQALSTSGISWIATDSDSPNGAGQWEAPRVRGETIAFLQYTSGSTSEPKGVVLTHRNLLHNSFLIQQCFGSREDGRIVSWLPPYHDMGLIGGILQPIFVGCRCVLIPPAHFVRSPLCWLESLSREKATATIAPNFAYEACARCVSPSQRDRLDLSSLMTAACGSEPIQADVIEAFSEFFAPCGFRAEAFRPCYGLAEATLIVSGQGQQVPPLVGRFDPLAFRYNRLADWNGSPDTRPHYVVACGSVCQGAEVVIADPVSGAACGPDQIGEIWVAGPSIAQGYWNRPQDTVDTFRARLSGNGAGCFLRTGDLGFLKDGQLFVAGRRKELIVVRGRNHHPHDLEAAARQSHGKLRTTASAAFAVAEDGGERIVIVQEVPRPRPSEPEVDSIMDGIRQAIHEECELPVNVIALVEPFTIPKTSSGKIQRHLCREAYLTGQLKIVKKWVRPEEPRTSSAVQGSLEQQIRKRPTLGRVRRWLVSRVSLATGLDASDVDHKMPLGQFGLDSLAAVSIANEIEHLLNLKLAPTLIWDHPCIEDLAVYLVEQLRRKDAPIVPSSTLETSRTNCGAQEAGSSE